MTVSSDDYRLWRTRISHALQLQSAQHRFWNEAQWFVEGTWFERMGLFDFDATPVNYATVYLRTLVAAIYSRNPQITIRPRHSRYRDFALSQDRVVNHLWTQLNLKQQVKRSIVDAGITGLGWIETGFTASLGTLDLTKADAKSNGLFAKLLGTSARPEEQGQLNEYIKEFSAYAVRTSPWKMLLAPGYHDIHTMPYLISIEDIAPADLRRSPLYSKAFDLDAIKPTQTVSTGDRLITTPNPGKSVTGQEPLMLTRLYHVWDRRGMQRMVFVEGSDESAGPFPWPYSHDGFAQTPLMFNELPETDKFLNAYPKGDITPMIPQLRELYWARTAMVRHRRRSGTLIICRKGALTSDQKKALESGDDVQIIEADDPSGIINHSPPALPEDLYRIDGRIQADLDLVGGLGHLLSSPSQGQRSATEINFRAQGTSFISTEKVDVTEEFSRTLARKLAAVAWEYYPRETIAEMLGEPLLSDAMWPQVPDDPDERRHLIQEELFVEIEAGSTQPLKDKTILREQKLRLINILMAVAPERIKKGPMVQELLDDFEFREASLFVIGDDQQEQQAALQENQALLQGLPQIVGPNELHDVHLQVHAQASQQGSTPALDQHLLAHQQMLLSKSPQRGPQQGDTRPQGGAAKPEQLRQGMPSLEDLQGVMGRPMSVPGEAHGGIPNLQMP